MTTDLFESYLLALDTLLERLERGHASAADALLYQQRLQENIERTRRYGDNENRRSERSEIIELLNRLCGDALGVDFNTLVRQTQAKLVQDDGRLQPAKPFEPETLLIPGRPGLVDSGDPSAPTWERLQHSIDLLLQAVQTQIITPEPTVPTGRLSDTTKTLPPPEPEHPPEIPGFVGREEQISYYTHKLETDHVVVLAGMPGVGKTALAARLVRTHTQPNKVFWHTFHNNEGGIETVLWRLAGYLAYHGQAEVWQMLQQSQQVGATQLAQVLLGYLTQRIHGRGYTLCLDDFHFLQDDPQREILLDGLLPLALKGGFSLIIVTRSHPNLPGVTVGDSLSGLDLQECEQMLAARNLILPIDLMRDLHTATEGNPEFLTLAMHALAGSRDLASLIARLIEAGDIAEFLTTEMDRGLTDEQRDIISAVALLLGYPGTRGVIEEVVRVRNVPRLLRYLVSRYLLSATPGEAGTEYSAHALVQAFYYDLLGTRERQEMHRRAGEFYELVEPDMLKAARHYERAGDYRKSTELITSHVWRIINRGEGRAMSQLLGRQRVSQLEPVQRTALNLARGQVLALLGDHLAAEESYQDVLNTTTDQPRSRAILEMRAQAYRGMGQLLKDDDPGAAIVWLQRGLAELDDDNLREHRAALLIEAGFALINLGDYAAALSVLREGLNNLPDGNSALRAAGLINLGIAYCEQGETQLGQKCYQEALTISEKTGDVLRSISARHNLAIEMGIAGDWETASSEYRAALALADQLGSVKHRTELVLSLGILETKRGEDEPARKHLEQALGLANQNAWREHQIAVLASLTDLCLRLGRADEVEPLLAEALRLVNEIGAQQQLPEILRLQAELHLARGRPAEALLDAEQSLALANKLNIKVEEGLCLRVLGQASAGLGKLPSALAYFKRSVIILEGHDPYETARTRMVTGMALLRGTDSRPGRALLEEAQVEFAKLGAQRDLTAVKAMLASG